MDISIIIATRHREQVLWETINKAVQAVKGRAAEIIVVNDGEEVIDVPGKFADKISYFNNPRYGVSAARNFGVEKSEGKLLFFIDDDMWINAEAINYLVENILSVSNEETVYQLNWAYPVSLQQRLTNTKVGQYLLSTNYHRMWGRLHKTFPEPEKGLFVHDSIGSGSLVMPRQVFEKIGGYNERIIFEGEDADLAGRLKSCGIPIFIVFDVLLEHNHQDRLIVENYLKRIYTGFESEFKAVKAGVESPLKARRYDGLQKTIFELSRRTETAWIYFLNLLPNNAWTTPVSNRLLGALGGLQRYKQWKRIMT